MYVINYISKRTKKPSFKAYILHQEAVEVLEDLAHKGVKAIAYRVELREGRLVKIRVGFVSKTKRIESESCFIWCIAKEGWRDSK
jgi:hypothetical protein